MLFTFETSPYLAVIGDLQGSRELSNRSEVQSNLKTVLDGINEQYRDEIAAQFTITLGDEFQGLLHFGGNAIYIIERIRRGIYPVGIRFGIGIGSITTEIDFERAIGADGPAYYQARMAIDQLKRDEQKNKKNAADIRIESEGKNRPVTELLNTVLSLLSIVKKDWTPRQYEIISDMIEHQDGQAACAARLEITQSTVQRGLVHGNYYAYVETLEKISNVLKEIRR